ncbi:MAG: radical SAM protein [Planctomycetota bacterium]
MSFYVGGGTRTVEPELILRFLRHVAEDIGPARDVSIELHPACADDACLAMLEEAGVTMVSVGAQSLTDRMVQLIGRSHDAASAEDAIRRAVAARLDTVNVDLMFALPGQTLEDLDRDLARVLALGAGQSARGSEARPRARSPVTTRARGRDARERVPPSGGWARATADHRGARFTVPFPGIPRRPGLGGARVRPVVPRLAPGVSRPRVRTRAVRSARSPRLRR